MSSYKEIAKQARLKVLDIIYKAQSSHIGSNFSCIDILTVLFEHIDLEKDKFILSKGWAAAALYYFLYKKGKITEEELNSYCQEGSKFIGLAEPIIPEIPFAGGSMGMGFPAAVGFALAKKLKGEEGNIYVLMSDGEMDCGTTWESALIASHHKLNNLVVLVDYNNFQAMGKKWEILRVNFPSKYLCVSGGWNHQINIDGHNFFNIESSLKYEQLPEMHRPRVLIFNTTKGKGVSFMEKNNLWHYKAPNEEEYERARKELEIS